LVAYIRARGEGVRAGRISRSETRYGGED